jgi:hypothetical protein
VVKKKYYLVKWSMGCKPKIKGVVGGRLGIKKPEVVQLLLLCKWWWKLENEEGLWLTLLKRINGIERRESI